MGLLEKQDGVRMRVRTLKRKLRYLGLKRKEAHHDEDIVRDLVKQEIQGAGFALKVLRSVLFLSGSKLGEG